MRRLAMGRERMRPAVLPAGAVEASGRAIAPADVEAVLASPAGGCGRCRRGRRASRWFRGGLRVPRRPGPEAGEAGWR